MSEGKHRFYFLLFLLANEICVELISLGCSQQLQCILLASWLSQIWGIWSGVDDAYCYNSQFLSASWLQSCDGSISSGYCWNFPVRPILDHHRRRCSSSVAPIGGGALESISRSPACFFRSPKDLACDLNTQY